MIVMYCVNDELSADLLIYFQHDICIPVRIDCKCKNDLDRYCYISGNVVLPNRQAKITDFVRKVYHDYFGIKLGDQYKSFAPHVCYKMCGELEGLKEL